MEECVHVWREGSGMREGGGWAVPTSHHLAEELQVILRQVLTLPDLCDPAIEVGTLHIERDGTDRDIVRGLETLPSPVSPHQPRAAWEEKTHQCNRKSNPGDDSPPQNATPQDNHWCGLGSKQQSKLGIVKVVCVAPAPCLSSHKELQRTGRPYFHETHRVNGLLCQWLAVLFRKEPSRPSR